MLRSAASDLGLSRLPMSQMSQPGFTRQHSEATATRIARLKITVTWIASNARFWLQWHNARFWLHWHWSMIITLTTTLSKCRRLYTMARLQTIYLKIADNQSVLGRFLPFPPVETNNFFVTSCLLCCTPNPFWKGVYTIRKKKVALSWSKCFC